MFLEILSHNSQTVEYILFNFNIIIIFESPQYKQIAVQLRKVCDPFEVIFLKHRTLFFCQQYFKVHCLPHARLWHLRRGNKGDGRIHKKQHGDCQNYFRGKHSRVRRNRSSVK